MSFAVDGVPIAWSRRSPNCRPVAPIESNGTEWLLLAIWIVLVGQSFATPNTQFGALLALLSVLPALLGGYLAVLELVEAYEK